MQMIQICVHVPHNEITTTSIYDNNTLPTTERTYAEITRAYKNNYLSHFTIGFFRLQDHNEILTE
ncbi:hypothetical protein Hanom_Chr10g00911241 [Helianthus anomalus]